MRSVSALWVSDSLSPQRAHAKDACPLVPAAAVLAGSATTPELRELSLANLFREGCKLFSGLFLLPFLSSQMHLLAWVATEACAICGCAWEEQS